MVHSFAVAESNKVYSWAQAFHTSDDHATIVTGLPPNTSILDIKSGNF